MKLCCNVAILAVYNNNACLSHCRLTLHLCPHYQVVLFKCNINTIYKYYYKLSTPNKYTQTLRVNSYTRNGWDTQVTDPDKPKYDDQGVDRLRYLGPTNGWETITTAYSTNCHLEFTNAQIISSFVTRTAEDGSDFKSLNSSAMNLFRCGHVQSIEVCQQVESSNTYLGADCLPEMKKDRVYKVEIKLEGTDVMWGRCGCPAGKGPTASCKNIAALCYALEEFARVRKLPEFLTCTDRLQSWNQPRPRKLKPLPIEMLSHRKNHLGDEKRKVKRTLITASTFDPQPTVACDSNPERVTVCITPADVRKIQLDHTYYVDPMSAPSSTMSCCTCTADNTAIEYEPRILSNHSIQEYKQSVHLDKFVREDTEVKTREQSSSAARAHKITGSVCGRILIQRKKTIPLLRHCLYKKSLLNPLPAAIAWGREKEKTACGKYEEYMHERGHHSLKTYPCGWVLHSLQ